MQRRIIVTGGPGAGKTALLAALAARGHVHVPETARAIIRDRKSRGLSPRPEPEIYTTDSERDQSFAESVRVHDTLCAWYRRCGYALVAVAPGSVDERCEQVLRHVDL
ncbi:MAG TPA: AAA family ATPase [Albitalea sp.]|uniref:AAA family ATPase n=1 Tax=Piscinibacter sp. TaxID=1903157 RepID=UPI002ED42021